MFVFVGASQTKIPYDLAAAMQQPGENGQYVKISGNGKKEVDPSRRTGVRKVYVSSAKMIGIETGAEDEEETS